MVLDRPRLGVADHEAGAVVVVAGLAHAAHGDDVAVAAADAELLRHHVVHLAVADREGLAQVAVPDERDLRQLVHERRQLAGLLQREDVLVGAGIDRRAVREADVADAVGVRAGS